ncbi:MAG: hypothetical protein HC933_11265 [Pleurocapsa sp. SU_196_0]|nr:hypothetical protein [Pleurocapsa sp. SU_196_0]
MKHVLIAAVLTTTTLALASSSRPTGLVTKLQLEDGLATLVVVDGQRVVVNSSTEDRDDLRLGMLTRPEVERVQGQWQALDVDVDADFDGIVDDDEALPDDEEEGDGLGE